MNNIKEGENYVTMSFLIFIKSLDWLWCPSSYLFNWFRSYNTDRKAAGE